MKGRGKRISPQSGKHAVLSCKTSQNFTVVEKGAHARMYLLLPAAAAVAIYDSISEPSGLGIRTNTVGHWWHWSSDAFMTVFARPLGAYDGRC